MIESKYVGDMKVALIGHRRPNYLWEVAQSLRQCSGFVDLVDEVVIMHDDARRTGAPCMELMPALIDLFKPRPARVVSQPRQCGIVGNTVLGMKACFDTGAETVFMLEDDGVLSPDSLRLIDWWRASGDAGELPQPTDRYVAFSLSAHSWQRSNPDQVRPDGIIEMNHLGCPFAYAVRAEKWPFIKSNWCCKNYHPCGWSWSMTYAARLHKPAFRNLAPMLSRTRNIGRELGVNESPLSWDASQGPGTGLTYSDGSFSGRYRVVEKIDERKAAEVDTWMLAEMARAPGEFYKAWVGFSRPPELDWEYYDGRTSA